MSNLAIISEKLFSMRARLNKHPLYDELVDISHIRLFMIKHVYAVWDFMSLLKALQNHLSCTSLPWKPNKNAKSARFINEIVWGEETDVNEMGIPMSHFEMYLDAMREIGINTWQINQFLDKVGSVNEIDQAISTSRLSHATKAFLKFTFEIIQTNQPHKIAAAFTFGREEIIPDMFLQIIENGNVVYPKLSYYLNRHIEVDGDEHGPLSLKMIQELCGIDHSKWNDVIAIATEALEKRIELWDEIAEDIKRSKRTYQKGISQELRNQISIV